MPGHVPREVVAELVLVLLGRLRRVGALADGTPFGKIWYGSVLAAPMWLRKSAYWKMNSFSFAPPSTQLWFRLIELNVFALSPQPFGAVLRSWRRTAACLCCGRSEPTGTAAAFSCDVTLPVNRFSRYGVAKTPSNSGNRPSVLTACVVSCCVRSAATKKCALSLTIGPPKLPPNWLRR